MLRQIEKRSENQSQWLMRSFVPAQEYLSECANQLPRVCLFVFKPFQTFPWRLSDWFSPGFPS